MGLSADVAAIAEIDHRPGYHVGGYIKHDSGIELSGLHYDNRADPDRAVP